MYILGIETSCDETSAAVIDENLNVKSNRIYQQKDHSLFGGVVPEIASREHVIKIDSIVQDALKESNIKKNQIGLIAATNSPGLIGGLLVGLSFAKGLSFSLNVPFVGVNHLDAHIKANYIEHKDLKPPFIALVISGGHTFIVYLNKDNEYELLGNTLDDACGEALDKAGKMKGLSYPAGREIEEISKNGNQNFVKFPVALPGSKNLNFSYSGLKTAFKNYIADKNEDFLKKHHSDIFASYQKAVIDQLVKKVKNALVYKKINKLVIAGGVACNNRLKDQLQLSLGKKNKLYFPKPIFCTDNGAMIAVAGYLKYKSKGDDPLDLKASAVFNIREVNYGP